MAGSPAAQVHAGLTKIREKLMEHEKLPRLSQMTKGQLNELFAVLGIKGFESKDKKGMSVFLQPDVTQGIASEGTARAS